MILPSPDGLFVASLGPQSLDIFSSGSLELNFSVSLTAKCNAIVWDPSSNPREYRLAISAGSEILSVGFNNTQAYHIIVQPLGALKSIQWVPMIDHHGRLVVRLASISDAPDLAQVWVNNHNRGQIIRPKSKFVALPSLNGWAILHTGKSTDKVTFLANGRFFSSIPLPTITAHTIVTCPQSPLVAVADSSSLYIVGPGRILFKATDLTVDEIVWLNNGDLIVSTIQRVLHISGTLDIKGQVTCEDAPYMYTIDEGTVVQFPNTLPLRLTQPQLLGSLVGTVCAIQSKPDHIVLIVNSIDNSRVLIDYRDPSAVLQWHGETLQFMFKEYGVTWSIEQGFGIVEYLLKEVLGFRVVPGTDTVVLWNKETFTSSKTVYIPLLASSSETSQVTAENLPCSDPHTPIPPPVFESPGHATTLTPLPDDMVQLKLPTISPYVNDYIPEDTFYYKRAR